FLGGFFGFTAKEAREKFHVEAGVLRHDAREENPDLGPGIAAAALAAADAMDAGTVDEPEAVLEVVRLLRADVESSNKKLLAGFRDAHGGFRARELESLASLWFASLRGPDQCKAARGLFAAIGSSAAK